MAETQSTDPQIRALQSSPQSPLVVEAMALPNSTHPLYCDTSTGTQRPLVQKRGDEFFLIVSTVYHTQIYKRPGSSLLLATYGLASILMFTVGHALVSSANMRRYNIIYDLHCHPFPLPKLISK